MINIDEFLTDLDSSERSVLALLNELVLKHGNSFALNYLDEVLPRFPTLTISRFRGLLFLFENVRIIKGQNSEHGTGKFSITMSDAYMAYLAKSLQQ